MKRSEAEFFIKSLLSMRSGANDDLASTSIGVYPTLKNNAEIVKAGTRINWNGVIKRASVDLWDIPENNPENAPTLWENIEYKDGYRIIPETITAGTAFALGEHGWWKDKLYVSLIEANVYNPDFYPFGWERVNT